MKHTHIIIIGLLLTTISCKAQLNNLNDSELFDGIKFNKVSLGTIMKSKGDLAQIKTLFGNDLKEEANNTAPFLAKELSNDNILFGFEDETDIGNNYDLTSIYVLNYRVSVAIKGRVIKLGDDKSKFGNLILNTNINSYVFTDQDTGSVSLSFQIDSVTNKVTKIKFIAF